MTIASGRPAVRGEVHDVLLAPTVQHQSSDHILEVSELRFAETCSILIEHADQWKIRYAEDHAGTRTYVRGQRI